MARLAVTAWMTAAASASSSSSGSSRRRFGRKAQGGPGEEISGDASACC